MIFTKQRLFSKQTSSVAHCKEDAVPCCEGETKLCILFRLNSFIKRVIAYCLLKRVIQGKLEVRIEVTGDEEEAVSSYWMTLRKRQDTGN
jgi:hypothetical protein